MAWKAPEARKGLTKQLSFYALQLRDKFEGFDDDVIWTTLTSTFYWLEGAHGASENDYMCKREELEDILDPFLRRLEVEELFDLQAKQNLEEERCHSIFLEACREAEKLPIQRRRNLKRAFVQQVLQQQEGVLKKKAKQLDTMPKCIDAIGPICTSVKDDVTARLWKKLEDVHPPDPCDLGR